MKKVRITLLSVLFLFFAGNIFAGGSNYIKLQQTLKGYYSDMSSDVQKAETPAEKREIIASSLNKVKDVLNTAESMAAKTDADRNFINNYRNDIDEKLAELEGTDGYEKVSDANLNDFANYVQQDMEQADKYVTLSLTTILLIVIIIILLA